MTLVTSASELTFGIEIECSVPNDSPIPTINATNYSRPKPLPGFPGWKVKWDITVGGPLGHFGVEIVSPVLKSEDGLRQVIEVLDYLNSIGAQVNYTCGLHIHVGAGHLNQAQVQKLTKLFISYEPIFYGLNSEDAEARGKNIYCLKSQDWGSIIEIGPKYRGLNIENWKYQETGRKTVEFRGFCGSLEAETVISAIYMAVGLVSHVSNFQPTFLERIENIQALIETFAIDVFGDKSAHMVPEYDGILWDWLSEKAAKSTF